MRILFLILWVSLFACDAGAKGLVLIAEDAAPNSFMEEGRVKGKAVEVVQAVLKEIGMAGTPIEVRPWSRGYRRLETEENVALFPTSRTPIREALFKWAGPIAENRINLYKLKSRGDIRASTLDDLKGFTAGSAGGKNNVKTQFLTAHGFEVELVDEDKQNIDKLFRGRVDFIPYSETRLRYDLQRYGYDPGRMEMILNIKEMSSKAYIAFNRSVGDDIVKQIQDGFDAIKNKGIQQEILNRWK